MRPCHPAGMLLIFLLVLFSAACKPIVAATQPAATRVAVKIPSPAPAPTETPIPPTPSPQPTATPVIVSALSDKQVLDGIQSTMDTFTFALDTNDRDKINTIIDQENKPWVRAMNDYLDQWGKYGLNIYRGSNYVHLQFTVVEVKRKPHDFIMARVQSNTKAEMTWLFRYSGNTWKMSEPSIDQLGEKKIKDDGKYKLQYYSWDEPLLDRYEKLVATMYDTVLKRTGLPMTVPVTIAFWPTQEVFPGQNVLSLGGVLAKADPEQNIIHARSLDTFGAGDWAIGDDPDAIYTQTLVHEFTHIVHGRFVSLHSVPMWMSEGFAEYIAQHQQTLLLTYAAQHKRIFGLQRLQKVNNFALLNVYVSQSDQFDYVYQAYNESESIVRYMVQKYGLDAFYTLNKEYSSSQDMDEAFKKVLGVNMQKFEQDWYAWLVK